MNSGSVYLYGLLCVMMSSWICLASSPDEFGEWSKDTNKLREERLVRDKEHLQEHLGNNMNFNVDDMSPEELDFHFFQIHDSDHDGRLDGLEMIHALQHSMSHSVGDMEMTNPEVIRQIHKHVTKAVDKILIEDDLDNNGYIDYTEFSQSRRTHILSNSWKRKQKGL